jgi:hypothetical protein
LSAVLLIALVGCEAEVQPPASRGAAQPAPWFEDVTDQWGLDFTPEVNDLERYFMPLINGAGVAIFDFDNDGRLDLYFLEQAGPTSKSTNRLYRQKPGGGFEDVTAGSGLDIKGYSNGVAVGDYDNDGWQDVLVTQYPGAKLLRNRGDGTFEDVTKPAGIDDPLWATSASFFDYDRDGWLDLFVANYVDYDPAKNCLGPSGKPDYCAPRDFAPTTSKLYHNRGDGGFEDVSESSGIAEANGAGLGVVAADFTGDGWIDLFVANDALPNHLWVNQRNGKFVDEALLRGVAVSAGGAAEGNMGIVYNDFDGDGLLDLFVTHLAREKHTLWKQQKPGLFVDRTAPSHVAGPGMRGTGFGVIGEDFDHDGNVDFAIVNGQVVAGEPRDEPRLGSHWSRYGEKNHLFANDGQGGFRNVSETTPAFCGMYGVWRGLACGDLDGDGDLELVATGAGQRPRIFRNVAAKRGHWLIVRPLNVQGQTAYGAEVTVTVAGRKLVRRVQSDGSYQSANSPEAHFGLGSATIASAIDVLWPDGARELFGEVRADQRITLQQGEGRGVP